jgi:hypothetical protein
MNEIIEAFHRLIPTRSKKTGRGWITFNCPACGDRRGRGGFLETNTGGFRYRCMNGGCRFEQRTGWEPDNGFMGRPRRLFELMGGDITDLPKELVNPDRRKKFAMDDAEQRSLWIAEMQAEWSSEAASTKLWRPSQEDEVALNFPTIKMPKDSVYLWDANTADALDVQRYAVERCRFFLNRAPLLWSPRYKRHVIIPFIEKHKFVGWIARKIDPGPEYSHIKCPHFPTDYMLNQGRRFAFRNVLVVQGAFDALALEALCTFGSVISTKQKNLLKQLAYAERRIVLVPDFKGQEWMNYLYTAREHGWYVSVPETWGGSGNESPEDYIKDPGDAIRRNGLLYTVETVMKSITNDYETAEATLLMRSR